MKDLTPTKNGSACTTCEPEKKESNSSPKAEVSRKVGQIKSVFEVSGMDCADEIQSIKKTLSQDIKIQSVEANLMTSKVTVIHDESFSSLKVADLIRKAGVRVLLAEARVSSTWFRFFTRGRLVALSGLFCGIGIAHEAAGLSRFGTNLSFILSVIAGGILVFPKAWRSLLHRNLDMNVLMSVAVVGAFAIGSHSEAAAVVFLFSLAEFLESLSVQRARRAISDVLKLDTDESSIIEPDGSVKKVPTENIIIGQKIKVLAGERIPLDGVVSKGEAAINEAPLTGESIPVQKQKGAKVFAGTLCENGTLEIEVTHPSTDSKLAQVIKLVEEAQATKAPSQRFVDKFSKIYTPAVFITAILVALVPLIGQGLEWQPWIYRSLVLLVIACPCALVIATPVAIVSSLTGLAKQGVLVKGGVHLETLGRLKALAIDKTGTLTEGKPKVLALKPLNGTTEVDLLRFGAALENESTHPLARAILNKVSDAKLQFPKVEGLQTLHGRGLQGNIEGHLFFLGNHRLAHELGVCTPELEVELEKTESLGRSVVVVGHMPHDGCKGDVMGVIELGDALRRESVEALKKLKEEKIQHIEVLSGDNQRTVSAIAKDLAVDSASGDLLPEDKVTKVSELKARFHEVAMIGDGVNDAPAMAQASIGISMGASGTDTALETSDVALMKDDLGKLALAVRHARKTVNTVRANIIFALGAKALFLVLLMVGISSMWLAVAADMGASLLVVASSLRLLRLS